MTDLDLILDAAKEAGELALQARAGGLKIWSKEGGSPVTDADLAVEATRAKQRRVKDVWAVGCRNQDDVGT